MQVDDALNKVDISVLRVKPTGPNDSGLISNASSITNDDYNSKRIRLGNDNYVISIQPIKDESDKNYARLGSGKYPADYSRPESIVESTPPDSMIYKKTVNKTTIKVPSICSCCQCCVQVFSLLLQCLQCLGSCLCTPFCCAAGVFGAFAAAAGVVALGVFGVIPIPVDLTNAICNSENHRNIFVTYENATVYNYSHNISTTTTTTTMITASNITAAILAATNSKGICFIYFSDNILLVHLKAHMQYFMSTIHI
jgi:hypothetical protein